MALPHCLFFPSSKPRTTDQTHRPSLKQVCRVLQEAPSKGTPVAPVQKDKAVEGGLPETAQEHKTLAGSLPQGLRTALGLSMGQPVGHLKPSMEKGQLDVGLPAASPATVTVATAAVPGVSTGADLSSTCQNCSILVHICKLMLSPRAISCYHAKEAACVLHMCTSWQSGMSNPESRAHSEANCQSLGLYR